MEVKKCTKCKTEKTLACFYKDKSKPDWHCLWCKVCVKEGNKRYKVEGKVKPNRAKEEADYKYTLNPIENFLYIQDFMTNNSDI